MRKIVCLALVPLLVCSVAFAAPKAETKTVVASSLSPSTFGQSVTFTATVTVTSGSQTPTGTVTFTAGGNNVLGQVSLTGGQASISTSSLVAGDHNIKASYDDGADFKSSFDTLSQTVNQASTTTTVSSSSNPSAYGQEVTFTAKVSAVLPGGGTPTGKVMFWDGSTKLNNQGAQLNNAGEASFTTSSLSPGAHSITASYEGGANSNFASSTSAAVSQEVTDNTPPVITPTISGTLGNNGWYVSNVTVRWEVSDPESGIASSSGSETVRLTDDTEGTTLSCSATNGVGLSSSISITLKIDTTPPAITGSQSPEANASGWNNTDVTVSFTASDATSGLDGPPPGPTTLSAEGANQSVTGTVTDLAGNSAEVTVRVKIDKTAPAITGSRSPDANANGWNNSDVTVSFTATDDRSGIAGVSGPTTLGEGADQSVTGTATDVAGNSASTTVDGIDIDKTPPTITGTPTPSANDNGWNNSDVTVSFTATDALSDIASVSEPATLSAEGAGQSVTGTAIDKAGNSASTTVDGINIDKTAPTITGSRSPDANANGWNNSDVKVSFTAADGLSGIDSVSEPTTLSADGAGQSVTGEAKDKAGNSASATVSGINIDKTAPTITGSRTPPPNAKGWNNTDVTVSFSATDALSGIASVSEPTTLSADGAGQSVTGTALDKAGNSASATVGGINIDKTSPTITFAQSLTELWPVDHKLYKVAVVKVKDNLDGSPSVTVSVTSNEVINGKGDGNTLPDYTVVNNGNGAYDVFARAERSGKSTGRTYTITVAAADAGGNSATNPGGVISVSHDQAKKAKVLLAKVGEEDGLETPEALPQSFGLDQSYPNPFNPSTTIRYALPAASNVSLVIYNLLGQQVRTLVAAPQGPGYYTVVWDGRDGVGRTAASGAYFYRLQAGTFSQVKKMLFAK